MWSENRLRAELFFRSFWGELNLLIFGHSITRFLKSILREVGDQNSCRFYEHPRNLPSAKETLAMDFGLQRSLD
jgi:hypothetical protein